MFKIVSTLFLILTCLVGYSQITNSKVNLDLVPYLEIDTTKKSNKPLYGYCDSRGNIIISPKFTSASMFEDNHAHVFQEELHGVIDKKGSIIVPIKSHSIFEEGDAQNTLYYKCVATNNTNPESWVCYDNYGKEIKCEFPKATNKNNNSGVPPMAEALYSPDHQPIYKSGHPKIFSKYYIVKENKKFGIKDESTGKMIIAAKYEEIFPPYSLKDTGVIVRALVLENGRERLREGYIDLIDTTFNVPCAYKSVDSIVKPYAYVLKEDGESYYYYNVRTGQAYKGYKK